MKKINDGKLLELLNSGKNQKQAAAILGVSEPAVSKRLKRLMPVPETPHFDQLTNKEKRYVIERVKGSTQTQSALKSFECGSMESAKVIGSQLAKKPDIEMSITELMSHCGIDIKYRMRRLKQIIDSKDLGIVHKGLDMSFKLEGRYAPEKIDHRGMTSAEITIKLHEKLLKERDKVIDCKNEEND